MTDAFNLERFIDAQAMIFETALAEITHGRKRTHWMWFVFPQLAGLGRSGKAQHFAISSLEEARAYLAHPILGSRLRQCVGALQDLAPTKAETVLGAIDALKLRSSLTLFIEAGAGPLFEAALARWFGNHTDPATLQLLRAYPDSS